MSIKRLKNSNLIRKDTKIEFSIIIDVFSNFSIKSGNDKMDFVATIQIRMTNLDKKSQFKDNSNLIPDKI